MLFPICRGKVPVLNKLRINYMFIIMDNATTHKMPRFFEAVRNLRRLSDHLFEPKTAGQ